MKKAILALIVVLCSSLLMYAPPKKVIKKESDDDILKAYQEEAKKVKYKEVAKATRSSEAERRFKDKKEEVGRGLNLNKEENPLVYMYGTQNVRYVETGICEMLNKHFMVYGYFMSAVKDKVDKKLCRDRFQECMKVYRSGSKEEVTALVLKFMVKDKRVVWGLNPEDIDMLTAEKLSKLSSPSLLREGDTNDDE